MDSGGSAGNETVIGDVVVADDSPFLALSEAVDSVLGSSLSPASGEDCSGVLKTLLERRLIRISGRKDVVGKPFLYSTTHDFLLHF